MSLQKQRPQAQTAQETDINQILLSKTQSLQSVARHCCFTSEPNFASLVHRIVEQYVAAAFGSIAYLRALFEDE